MHRLRFALFALASINCAPASSFEGSALAQVEGHFAVAAPAAPAEAEAPRFTTCPAGWQPTSTTSAACEPWPAGRQRCTASNEAQFVGEPGCRRVGSECAADGWPTDIPLGVVHFIKQGAAAGGDGSKERPFATLAQALTLGPGRVLALGPGRYETAGALPERTTVLGTCVAQTTLANSTEPSVVLVQGSAVVLKNLHIIGPGVGLGVTGSTAELTLEGVVVSGTSSVGLLAQAGAHVTGHDVVLRGTTASATGSLGHGLHVTDAARVALTRVAIEGNRTTGVFLFGRDAQVTLTDASIVDTAPGSTGSGRGVWVNAGTSASLVSTTIEANFLTGLEVSSGGTAELTDVVVRGTRASPGNRGDGVWVDGGRLIGQRVRVEGSANLGVGVTAAPAFAVLTDFISSGDFGVGVNVGGTLILDRAWIHDTLGGAVNVRGEGATATLTDLVVTDVRTTPGNVAASGLSVLRGGFATISRARFERCTGIGVAVMVAGSKLNASDLKVLDTQPGSDGEGGFGIVDQSGEVQLERAGVRGSITAALLVDGAGARLTLTDIELADTQPPASQGGLYGDGLVVSGGASVTGTRVRLTGNHDVGLLVSDPASRATLSEVLVRSTSLTCSDPSLCGGHAASGVTVLAGGSAALSRFLVMANGGFGAQIGPAAQLDLSAGEISYHQVGLSVLEPSFDLARLETDVVLFHNEQKVSSVTVPLPRVPRPPQLP